MSKKIDQLDPATDAEAKNDSYLMPIADPVNGVAVKMTIAQAKDAFGTKTELYTATGSEGSTLSVPVIVGKDVLCILRESGPIWKTESFPDSSQYTWNDSSIGLGAPVSGAGERFLIFYRTY